MGDVAEITGGGTPSTQVEEYWNGSLDWHSSTEIGLNVYANNSVKKITELGLKNSSAKILPANKTILFTSRAGIGDMAILTKNAATNQGFQSLIINDDFNVYFIYSMGHTIKFHTLKQASGSTFLEISGKSLANIKLRFPSLKEQTKIGEFFKQLDEAIALKEQEIESIKQSKQGFLQKMFV